MSRAESWAVHVANGVVVVTGVVYAVMKFLMSPADEWAVVNHPWQPHVHHLHVLAAPLMVFVMGLLWNRHVVRKLRNGADGRVSGVGLTVAFVPMAASGYLIQVSVEPSWRTAWVVVHLVASGLWVVVFAAHQLKAILKPAAKGGDVAACEGEGDG